jgi:hypothetical protein
MEAPSHCSIIKLPSIYHIGNKINREYDVCRNIQFYRNNKANYATIYAKQSGETTVLGCVVPVSRK